jgi:hypothetical protein
MTKNAMPSNVVRQLAGLARRLQDNPDFMAYVLAAYKRQETLMSDNALAKRLNATPAMLTRLALCKRPVPDSPQFAEQVRQIAAFTNIDAAQLANIVRQVNSLEKLFERPKVLRSEEADVQQMQLYPGLLAATRDRSDSVDDQPAQLDEETPSED